MRATFSPFSTFSVENFRQRGEVGASACVTFEGETVLDVWGGPGGAGYRFCTDRCQLLVDAAYRAVGFRSDAPGCWVP